jgi:hypothetical protein
VCRNPVNLGGRAFDDAAAIAWQLRGIVNFADAGPFNWLQRTTRTIFRKIQLPSTLGSYDRDRQCPSG